MTTATAPRTDIHRTSQIVTEEYAYVFTFAHARMCGGWPEPSFNFNCALDRAEGGRRDRDATGEHVGGIHRADGRCCIVGLQAQRAVGAAKFADHGSPSTCTVCGARFNDGDVWFHEPTSTYLFIGHECAEKYQLLADRGDYNAFTTSRERGRAAYRLAQARKSAYDTFCEKHEGLAADLKVPHRIVEDIASKLRRYGSLSDAQVALVRKLANEVRNPPPAEAHVPAPEGRVEVTGTVVSIKPYTSDLYGTTMKMTVKVETPKGSWLCWGTVPAAIDPRRGDQVTFSATLKHGNEPHFAIYSRPTKARLVTPAPAQPQAA
jgi:hypothetical protein